MRQTNSTAPAEIPAPVENDLPSVGDVIDKLNRVISLNELVFMAGESLVTMLREPGEAITTGADVINDLLKEVKADLYAIQSASRASRGAKKGGAA